MGTCVLVGDIKMYVCVCIVCCLFSISVVFNECRIAESGVQVDATTARVVPTWLVAQYGRQTRGMSVAHGILEDLGALAGFNGLRYAGLQHSCSSPAVVILCVCYLLASTAAPSMQLYSDIALHPVPCAPQM